MHFGESGCRKKAAYWRRIPACSGRESGTDGFEIGQAVFLKVNELKTIEILLCGVLFQLRQNTSDKLNPYRVLLSRVGCVILTNDERRAGRKRFDLHRFTQDRLSPGCTSTDCRAPAAPVRWLQRAP